MDPVTQISLDYPITPRPRWGHGKPAHPRLHAIMDVHRAHYAQHLQTILSCELALKAIPIETQDPTSPAWVNPWFSGLDLAALHMFVSSGRPARYLEIGSGTTTKIARHAALISGHSMHITSVDPTPRAEINQLCDRIIRQPVEDVAGTIFDDLTSGDILFIDNSHRVFTNSDSVVLLLEVLPRLPPGVLVHIHDIYLPYDYPPEWSSRYYSEQYLLAAWLLAEGPHFRIELPNMFVSLDSELASRLNPLWTGVLSNVQRHGGSFWLRSMARARL
jgi:hypothetical protein